MLPHVHRANYHLPLTRRAWPKRGGKGSDMKLAADVRRRDHVELRNQSRDAADARDALARAEADYKVQKLKAEQAKQAIPQPDWTAVPFRPFHPAGAALPVAAPQPTPPRPPTEPITSPQPPAAAAAAADLFGDPAPAPAATQPLIR